MKPHDQIPRAQYMVLIIALVAVSTVFAYTIDFFKIGPPAIRVIASGAFTVAAFALMGFFKRGQVSPFHRKKNREAV